jgi:3-methylfumaryl-CoA hydratase
MSPSEPLGPSELDDWGRYVGRAITREQFLDVESLRRYAVAVGASREVERSWPPIGHWAYFVEVVEHDQLGTDGHPRRGSGLIPPIRLQRRMFAASSIQFSHTIELNRPAQMEVKLAGLERKLGGSGDLIFVKLQRVLTQQGQTCIAEQQTIVYLNGGVSAKSDSAPSLAEEAGADVWTPNAVELFRFSAATFNSHRIHYDLRYAQGEEGYPGLVVQGPLAAAKLHAYAQSRSSTSMTAFAFRTKAPLFVDQAVRLRQNPTDQSFEAVRCDGIVAVSARATF